jgi:hypothetical protein
MAIELLLNRESYDCLTNNVHVNSALYDTLKNSVKLDASAVPEVFIISCDEEQAEFLLLTAKKHCPSAVLLIETAIKVSQVPRP